MYLELHQMYFYALWIVLDNCVPSNFNPSTFEKAISVDTAKYNDHQQFQVYDSIVYVCMSLCLYNCLFVYL